MGAVGAVVTCGSLNPLWSERALEPIGAGDALGASFAESAALSVQPLQPLEACRARLALWAPSAVGAIVTRRSLNSLRAGGA